jgi:pimeloyl-ACP methyl ester carboxylesterase
MTGREVTLNLPALRLAARVFGNPALPPLLALHGWLDNAASFDRLAPLLAEQFHVVALDLPGHGRSDWRPAGTWYHYIDYVSDVVAAADVLGWPRFDLLGHSLGGAVASTLAAACPHRVRRLLLIEALGPASGEAEQALTALRRGFEQRAEFAAKTVRVFDTPERAVAARCEANGLSVPAATLLVARGIEPVAGGYRWSSDPRLTLATPVRMTEAQILAQLRGIEAPTLLVLAEPPMQYLAGESIQQRIAVVARLTVRRLRGGHHLHLEDPQPVAAAIEEFCAAGSAAD